MRILWFIVFSHKFWLCLIIILTGYPTDYQVAADLDSTEDCTIHINKVHNDVCQLRFVFQFDVWEVSMEAI